MLYFTNKIMGKDQNRTISNDCKGYARSRRCNLLKVPAACVLLASSIGVANAAKYEVSFKSAHGKYFVSEHNGGFGVNANHDHVGDWEKFHINDLNDTHCIRHGDVVTINTGHHWHWQPTWRFGDRIGDSPNLSSNWFYAGHIFDAPKRIKFRLTNHSDANGCLADGNQISLQSVWTNKYITAEPNGKAMVDRSNIGPWEKITVKIHQHMNPDPGASLFEQLADSPLWDLMPDTLNSFAEELSNIVINVTDIADIFISFIDSLKDKDFDVIYGFHGARDEIPFGNTKVPQSDRAGWKTDNELVQGHIDQYADRSYNAADHWNYDNGGKKDYARTILAKLYNAERAGEAEAPAEVKELINGAAAMGPWGVPGTHESLFVQGDYDFAEVNLVATLWRFHHLLGDTEIDNLLGLLVSEGKPGISLLGFFNHFSQIDIYGAPILFFTPETENHILKTEGTRYLKNKWIYDNNLSNDSTYNNASNGVGDFLANYLDHTIRATVYEYNSIPYGESTLMALLNLEAYADGEVQRKARELLDTMMFKYAISSLNGKRWAPMRRKHEMLGYEHYSSDDTTSLARAHIANNAPHIGHGEWVNEELKLGARSGVVLYTALLPYRIPQATLNLMRSTDKSYFATLGRGKLSSPELYSAGPGYLLTAGGVIPDNAADNPHCVTSIFQVAPSCSDQVMRSTTLSLASLPIDNHKYGFRMSGGNHEGSPSKNNKEVSGVIYDENTQAGTNERYYSYADFNNTCVYENFACSAGRVWIPKSERLHKFSMHCEDEPNGVDIANLSDTTEKNLNQWCIYTTPRKDLHIAVYSSNTLGTMALVQDRHASIAPSTLLRKIVKKNANESVLSHQFTWPKVKGVPNGTISYDRHAHPEDWAITGVTYAQQAFNDLSRDYQNWPQITLVSGSLNADIPEVNIAAGNKVSQSSTAYGGAASRAVDGNTSGTYSHGSVTHTRYEDRPWWKINFNEPKHVAGITLWNRTDCCTQRLSDFEVLISTDMGPMSLDFSGTTVDGKLDIPLNFKGSVYSIKIRLKGKGVLSLAEVQVWSLDKPYYTDTTPANDDGGWNNGNTIFLDRHEPNCGPFGLNSVKLYRPTKTQIAYGYTCINVDDSRISGWESTPANAWGNGHNAYLDRHAINCGDKPIKAFRLTRPSESQLSYAYKCGSARLSQITNHYTGWNDNGDGNAIYLDRHNVSCPAGRALTYARLQNNGNGEMRYHYKCGTP